MTRFAAVVLLGAPASGKGTQGRILGAAPAFVHVEMGAVLRAMEHEGDIGRAVAQRVEHGALVPDDVVLSALLAELDARARCGKLDRERDVLVLDGVPRTAGQADALEEHADVLRVVSLEAADENVLKERILGRMEREGRPDDAREVVERRLAGARARRESVLARYPDDLVARVDALGPPLRVAIDVFRALADLDPLC